MTAQDDRSPEQRTQEVYRAIGEFIVEFEQVNLKMQTCILAILERNGLPQRLAQVVIAGLTADPLRALFGSLVAEGLALTDPQKKYFKDPINRFQKLTESRNIAVHSAWFVGYGSDVTDWVPPSGLRYEKNKAGLKFEPKAWGVKEFDDLTKKAKVPTGVFFMLNAVIRFHEQISLEGTFDIDERGFVSMAQKIHSNNPNF